MKFDIIETNYLKSLRGFSLYFKIIAIIATIFLIFDLTANGFFIESRTTQNISAFFIGAYFILELLNTILFSRIGTMVFENSRIIISKDQDSEFSVSQVNIKISKVQSNHYLISSRSNFKETVELKDDDLNKLKIYFENHQIEYEIMSIDNWIRKVFGWKINV